MKAMYFAIQSQGATEIKRKLNDNEIERERETIQQEIDSGIIPDPKAKQDDDGGF